MRLDRLHIRVICYKVRYACYKANLNCEVIG